MLATRVARNGLGAGVDRRHMATRRTRRAPAAPGVAPTPRCAFVAPRFHCLNQIPVKVAQSDTPQERTGVADFSLFGFISNLTKPSQLPRHFRKTAWYLERPHASGTGWGGFSIGGAGTFLIRHYFESGHAVSRRKRSGPGPPHPRECRVGRFLARQHACGFLIKCDQSGPLTDSRAKVRDRTR